MALFVDKHWRAMFVDKHSPKDNFKPPKNRIGALGERLAVRYLINHGYSILHTNFRAKFGEIDIIAQKNTGEVIFVEVKSVSGLPKNGRWFSPEDHISTRKLFALRRICQFFANQNSGLVDQLGWQIDVIAIAIPKPELSEEALLPLCLISHYENI